MDREQISNAIQEPSFLTSIETASLEALLSEYPYFEIGHLMLVKKYQTQNHLAFDDQLQKSAIYAADRAHLFDWIRHQDIDDIVAEMTDTSSGSHSEGSDDQSLVDSKEEVNPISSNFVSKETADYQDQLDDQSDTGHAGLVVENPASEVTGDIEKLVYEPDAVVSNLSSGTTFDSEEDLATEEAENKEADFKEDHSFTDWLHVINHGDDVTAGQSQEHEIAKAKAEMEIDTDIEFIAAEEPATLDEFLEKNISRKPEETDEIDVAALAKHSVEPDEDLVSETFAQLLVLQKKYDHAIQAYQKLGLKYPEKSSYFALRIEEIKKLR